MENVWIAVVVTLFGVASFLMCRFVSAIVDMARSMRTLAETSRVVICEACMEEEHERGEHSEQDTDDVNEEEP